MLLLSMQADSAGKKQRLSGLTEDDYAALVQRSNEMIHNYRASSRVDPMYLPIALRAEDHALLHDLAGELNLYHHSIDRSGHGRQVCVQKTSPNISITPSDALLGASHLVVWRRPTAAENGKDAVEILRGYISKYDPETALFTCTFKGSIGAVTRVANLADVNGMMNDRYDQDRRVLQQLENEARQNGWPALSGALGGTFSSAPALQVPKLDVATYVAGCDPFWNTVDKCMVKYDAYHWLGVFSQMVDARKDSPLARAFMKDVASALFQIRQGEYERVVLSLRGRVPRAKMKTVARGYFRRRCRQVCPEPKQQTARLVDVFNYYYSLEDPGRPGSKFLSCSAVKDFNKSIKWVQKGKLSDPLLENGKPMDMYIRTGWCESSGMDTYHAFTPYVSPLETTFSV